MVLAEQKDAPLHCYNEVGALSTELECYSKIGMASLLQMKTLSRSDPSFYGTLYSSLWPRLFMKCLNNSLVP